MEPIKQMTEEEKLEKAKELYKTANADQRYVLERLFPELIGTNADKISEAVLQYFEEVSRLTFNGFRKDEIITWLKNRKELILDLKNQIESLYAAINTLKDAHKIELEKLGDQILANSTKTSKDEQKPADTEKGAKGNDREIPNSTWSEQDDINLEKAIWYVEHPAPMVVNNSMLVEWLKSLKDKVGNFDDGYKVGFSAAKYNQWKPSDGQIQALEFIVEYHAFANQDRRKDVVALLSDLKKLMEE